MHVADALNHVKTLQGLLPICAWCKRVRDDEGYWDQVEAYFHKYTGVDFTHGICPECLEKARPKVSPNVQRGCNRDTAEGLTCRARPHSSNLHLQKRRKLTKLAYEGQKRQRAMKLGIEKAAPYDRHFG